MTDRHQKEPQPLQQEQPDADSSGSLQLPEELKELTPIAPLLEKSVAHMKKGNEQQLKTNCELKQLNRNQVKQHRVTWLNNILILALVGGLIFALLEQRKLRGQLDVVNTRLSKANTELATVSTKLAAVETDTKTTKEAVEKQPKISVKADPTTSSPMLIVEQPPSTNSAKSTPTHTKNGPPPAKPKARGDKFEFPLGPPRKKEMK